LLGLFFDFVPLLLVDLFVAFFQNKTMPVATMSCIMIVDLEMSGKLLKFNGYQLYVDVPGGRTKLN
jgi:hypothetical protein